MWDDLAEPTATDRVDLGYKMAQTNQANIGTGEVVFTPDQIQVAAGYEAQKLPALGEDV
jgi:hypothetical protein